MKKEALYSLRDIIIRNDIHPGDAECIISLHGKLYREEYGYGIAFEKYVTAGFYEFLGNYDADRDRVWICEHAGKVIGCLLCMHRDHGSAQLRYFLIDPAYRGIGLGKKLMELFILFLKAQGYQNAYLWTTRELYAAASLYKQSGFVLKEEKASEAFGKKVIEQRYDLEIKK